MIYAEFLSGVLLHIFDLFVVFIYLLLDLATYLSASSCTCSEAGFQKRELTKRKGNKTEMRICLFIESLKK